MEPQDLNLSLLTLTAATATAGTTTADFHNRNCRGAKVVLDITAISGTNTTLTVTVQGKDIASGKYYTILASAGKVATGTTVLSIYPGLTAASNVTASDVLPEYFRLSYVITTDTTAAVTATVGACLLV